MRYLHASYQAFAFRFHYRKYTQNKNKDSKRSQFDHPPYFNPHYKGVGNTKMCLFYVLDVLCNFFHWRIYYEKIICHIKETI